MRLYSVTTACVLAGALAMALPATSHAQAKKTSGTFTAAAEIGARAFTTEPADVDKGKFEEYRSLPAGAILERFSVGYTPADETGTYQLTGRHIGQLDQSLWLQASRPNLYDFSLRWDKTPHIYSSTGRSPGNEGVAALGFNTLPSTRPDSTAWKNAPLIGNIRTIWDPISAKLALYPSEALDTKIEWLHIGKKGGIPKSITFSATSGPTREYVSPIDESINNFKVAQSYASGTRAATSFLGEWIKSFQGTVSYEYSKYTNNLSSVYVDNPQISTASISGTVFGASTARVALAPSNSAQTMSLMGSVLLPFRTRVTGSVNASMQDQNEAFIAPYNNTALAADVNASKTTLPRSSLDGKVKLTTVNITASSHPIDKLSLGAKYRNHSYSNQTEELTLAAISVADRAISAATGGYSTEADPFTKVNTDLTAAYQVVPNGSIGVGYAVEDFTREPSAYRIDGTREKAPRVSVDYSGISWLSLHAGYLTSQRKFYGQYREAATEVTDMRSYMFANRDRKRTNLMATVTPFDQISVGLSYQNNDDKYRDLRFGITSDKLTSTGVDIDYTPMSRLSMGLGYTDEKGDNIARYRYRTGAVGSATYDNPGFYWTTSYLDRNKGLSANVKATLIPDKLEMTVYYANTDAKSHVLNVNDVNPPTGGTAANQLAATVENWPEVSQKLTPLNFAFQYKVSADWAFTLRYNAEEYTNHNFQAEAPNFTTTTVLGGTPVATSWVSPDLPGNVGATTGSNTGQYHFLGANYHSYKASWLTFTVSWHPSSLPPAAGRAAY